MARLLAYGGKAFVERKCIGEWPQIAPGVLWDYYGVASGQTAFGCGFLGGVPFLIWRVRCNLQNRGGYPYTLLLDPGTQVWKTFEYSAAALLSAILVDEELATRLVDDIETVSSEWLNDTLAILRPPPAGCAQDGSGSLWPVALMSQAPLALSGSLPNIQECSSWIANLPVCFRLAGGWLVSGSILHANAYGINLVFDPDFGLPPRPGDRNLGESILANWRAAEEDCQIGPAVKALSRVPAEYWGTPVQSVLHQIEHGRVDAIYAAAEKATGEVPNRTSNRFGRRFALSHASVPSRRIATAIWPA